MPTVKRVVLARSAMRSSVTERFLPLGLLYLASYLRQHHPEIDVRIVDLFVDYPEPSEAAARIAAYQPDLVGIGSFNVDGSVAHQVAHLTRQALPRVPIVFGGPYASCSWRSILRDPNVDAAAIGEGEETFLDLVRALNAGTDLAKVAGLAVRGADGQAVQTPERAFIQDLDAIPMPAWDLVKFADYDFSFANQYLFVERRNAVVFTSRGCPYRCSYCHHVQGKKFRSRSPENVIAELRILRDRYGVRDVLVQDDIFNFDLGRAKTICRAVVAAQLGLNWSFPNGLRGEIIDDELLDLFREMGTIFAAFAIETASEERQKTLGRRSQIGKICETIRECSARGIFTHCFFMIGFDGETREEMEATIDLACSLPLNSISLSVVNYYDESVAPAAGEGHRTAFTLDAITGYDYQTPKSQRSRVSDDELLDIRNRGYRRFYTNPSRVLRILRQTPNRSQLIYKGWVAATRAFHGRPRTTSARLEPATAAAPLA
jgi:anaerobic magnesium-protoporphyrin IX monomethyl ester cyclase